MIVRYAENAPIARKMLEAIYLLKPSKLDILTHGRWEASDNGDPIFGAVVIDWDSLRNSKQWRAKVDGEWIMVRPSRGNREPFSFEFKID